MSGRYAKFTCHALDDSHIFYVGSVPEELLPTSDHFEALWALHPNEFHTIKIHGRDVKTPRWQQAFGMDYHYTGRVNRALPVPPLLEPLRNWAQRTIDERLNGMLLNWYDGRLGHYIGKHRDSRKNMIVESPIVTISFGEKRVFRLRPWKGKGIFDVEAADGTVFVMPFATNIAWTHEVRHSTAYRGRRISVTLRAFTTTENHP